MNLIEQLIEADCAWIKTKVESLGFTDVVIGISGGKDSTVVAGLCVKALGKEHVHGVMMPCGKQKDIADSRRIIKFLGIDWLETNIKPMVDAFTVAIEGLESSAVAKTNLPARVRMTTLMGIGQTNNWLVANTCNLSEDFVGYATLWGDSCGSFAPISKLTTEEIIAIGKELGLPIDLVEKTPADGLQSKSDEDNLGFTYHEINKYIRLGEKGPNFDKIQKKYFANKFKTEIIQIPAFEPGFPSYKPGVAIQAQPDYALETILYK